MDEGSQVDCIFTDYSKFFDRIDQKILLQKIMYVGIRSNLYWWMSSYIQNHSQVEAIKGVMSWWHLVPSGLSQGSLLVV